MRIEKTQFVFDPTIPMQEVRGTLRLAQIAAESLHGVGRVQLEVLCDVNLRHRKVLIDARTNAGRTVAMIFLGYAQSEFGGDAVRVQVDRRET